MAEADHAGRAPLLSRISDGTEISYLLSRLIGARSVLDIPLHGRHYRSQMLASDPGRRGFLTLDALSPDCRDLRPGMVLVAAGNVDGVDLRWQSPVIALEPRDGRSLLRVRWPDAVEYAQRRSAFRSAVPAESAPQPSVFGGVSQGFRGRLVDLSETGFGAVTAAPAALSVGDRLPCALMLSELNFVTDMEVRYQRATFGKTRFGGRFLALTAGQRAALDRAVFNLQRRWIQSARRSA